MISFSVIIGQIIIYPFHLERLQFLIAFVASVIIRLMLLHVYIHVTTLITFTRYKTLSLHKTIAYFIYSKLDEHAN